MGMYCNSYVRIIMCAVCINICTNMLYSSIHMYVDVYMQVHIYRIFSFCRYLRVGNPHSPIPMSSARNTSTSFLVRGVLPPVMCPCLRVFRKVLSLPLQVLTGVASGLRVDESQDMVTEKEPKEVDRRALTHAWNHSWSHTKRRGLQYNGQCIIITVTVLNNYNSLAIIHYE